MENIVFIGGIHGSGKGKVCEKIKGVSNLIHLTASEVLKWHELCPREEKIVRNIGETQERLITNLKSIIKTNQRYLLDGHYCLLNENGIPERIPFSTFENISPSKLILVIADPEVITERLKQRDSKEYTKMLISEFQQLEIVYAKELERQLKIPLLTVNSMTFDFDELIQYIQ